MPAERDFKVLSSPSFVILTVIVPDKFSVSPRKLHYILSVFKERVT